MKIRFEGIGRATKVRARHSRIRRAAAARRSGIPHLTIRDRAMPAVVLTAFACLGAAIWTNDRHATRLGPNEVEELASLLPALVPFDLRPQITDRVDYWMERFTTDRRRDMEIFLSREGHFGGLIQDALRKRGMPEELLYLAMIESGFETDARSAVSAIGVWQFMGPTAVQYGLRLDEWVDERRDPVQATEAALDYLESLYARFGSWYLAAAAYNAGPNRVAYLLRRSGVAEGDADGPRDERLYWEIVDRLPRETRDYVPKLIASMMVAKHQDRYGLEVEEAAPYMYDRVWVPGGTSLTLLASQLSLDPTSIRDLNPHLIQRRTPPGEPYPLRIPVGQSQRVVALLDPVKGRRGKAVN